MMSALQRLDVEALERLGVVEVLAQRVAAGECWWSTDRSSWFGHQSWFVRGRCAVGSGAVEGWVLALRHVGPPLGGLLVVHGVAARRTSPRRTSGQRPQ